MDTLTNETEYTVKLPDSGQEITIARWSLGELCQMDADMELLTFGAPAGQPPASRQQTQISFHTIVLTTLKCKSYEELADKYLGKQQTIANLNIVGNSIVNHERIDWLKSRGYGQEMIDKYWNKDGTWKQGEPSATQQKSEGNGKPPLARKKAKQGVAATGPIT